MQISIVSLACIAVWIDTSDRISSQTRWLLIGHTAPHSKSALFSDYKICCYSPVLGQPKIYCSVVLAPAVSALLCGIRACCYQSNLPWFKGIMLSAPFILTTMPVASLEFDWDSLNSSWIILESLLYQRFSFSTRSWSFVIERDSFFCLHLETPEWK